jgi:hypothetical protein
MSMASPIFWIISRLRLFSCWGLFRVIVAISCVISSITYSRSIKKPPVKIAFRKDELRIRANSLSYTGDMDSYPCLRYE